MLAPNPISLLCALLLCLPLALVFTCYSTTNTTSIVTDNRVTLTPLPRNLASHRKPHKPSLHPLLSPPPPSPPTPSPSPPPPSPPPPSPSPPPPSPPPPSPPPPSPSPSPPPPLDSTLSPPPTPTFSPPPKPKYEPEAQDDLDLLRRASRLNPTTAQEGPKKVAFLFLTTTPLPFASLWEQFFNQSSSIININNNITTTNTTINKYENAEKLYNIYVHVDPRNKYDNPPFTGVFSGRVIPSSKPTRRNTPTLITAARRLLAHAMLDDPNNYMFTILSSSCIPLHSFNFTYHTLVSSEKSFIEILSHEGNTYQRWAARGESVMLPELPLEAFKIGSQFWSLTRRHARVVVSDETIWSKFRLTCVDVNCYPEESYFPTLLSMVDPHGVVPTTLTNVNWRGCFDGHPRTYNGSEVGPGLIRWLRDAKPRYGDVGMNGSDLVSRWDPFLFARKFAPNSLEVLLRFAKDVIFKD